MAGPDKTAHQELAPLVAVCILFLILNTLFLALRLISRRWIKKVEGGMDDYLIWPAWLVNIAACITGLIIAHYESIGNLPAHEQPKNSLEQVHKQLEPTLKSIFAIVQLVIPAFTLPKLSILFLYLRIFQNRTFRVLTYGLIMILILNWLAYSLTAIFACQPVSFFWDRTITYGTCIDINRFYRFWSIPNIATDVLLLALPIPTVWKMDATIGRKIGLTIIFLSGTLGLLASAVRWVIFARYDVFVVAAYVESPLISLVIVEPGVYFICACLPALYPLIERTAPASLRRKVQGAMGPRPAQAYSGETVVRRPRFGSHQSFTRLVDGPGTTVSVSQGTLRQKDVERHLVHQLRLDDLARIKNGTGIAVQTEVEISTSDRLDMVLGM